MSVFTMSWPAAGLRVTCKGTGENENALSRLLESLPVRVVQGHELVGGWALRCRSLHFSSPYDLDDGDVTQAQMKDLPEGAVCLLFPQGSTGELLVKYGPCADDRPYIPIAQVEEGSLAQLKAAGAAVWGQAMNGREIIQCEISKEADAV